MVDQPKSSMATYFITGSSRGIGLEFVRQILESNPENKVIASARNPESSGELLKLLHSYKDRLTLISLDVTNENTFKGLGDQLDKTHPTGIDYLINNAGIVSSAQSTKADFLDTFSSHVIGPFLLFQELYPLVQKSTRKVAVGISSMAGSIGQQKLVSEFYGSAGKPGDYFAYRVSKAAENALFAALANDSRYKEIISIAIHPGLVATDMVVVDMDTAAPLSPKESVTSQLKVFERLNEEDSGKFFNYDGTTIPW